MGKGQPNHSGDGETTELLRDILIAQLAIAGLSNDEIGKITKCNRNRLADIAKHIRAAQRRAAQNNED